MQLAHGRVSIELHELTPGKAGERAPLLLLHALGENAESWSEQWLAWPGGPVYALDFAGHGQSARVRGGAYYPEFFLADADLALDRIGEPLAVVGAGVGAYVAFLLAAARANQIEGTLLLDGPGLAGAGSVPDHELEVPRKVEDIEAVERFVEKAAAKYTPGTDPWVAHCERDLRPLDYVGEFARAAKPMLFSEKVGRVGAEPDWWRCGFEENSGVPAPDDLEACLSQLASLVAASAPRRKLE